MRRLALAIPILLLAAACDDPPPVATLHEIPAAFVGAWDASVDDCGHGGSLAVSVAPDEVRFSDSTIVVTGVAPDGPDAARVDGKFTSAETSWDGAVRLELANGGRELNVVNGSTLSPRVKCP
jgi:hypothetical protein